HPPLTGYRLLVTSLTVTFGALKAELTYLGRSTEAGTLEWTFGTIITVFLYCLGLYEASSTRVMPWLFERDY
ncbi:hypothetical protein BKA70DRAFT_1044551, partial [Coprinopsis sp. MPI-PUGE-AT-0042]